MKRDFSDKFKRGLYFFDWLEQQNMVCDGCGVEQSLCASIFNTPFKPYKEPEALRFCEFCYQKLKDD